MIIRSLLDRIEDSKTGKMIDDLFIEIPESMVKAAQNASRILGDTYIKKIKIIEGVKPLHSENVELLLNNLWRPTLAVTGASGLPVHTTAGNVLRASTSVRLGIRLPPTKDSKKTASILTEILTKDAPFDAKIRIQVQAVNPGWAAKDFSVALRSSLKEVSDNFFDGKEFAEIGCGGSIPFIKELNDEFPDSDFVVTGVLGPGSNAHSINECIHIGFTKRITSSISHILANIISA